MESDRQLIVDLLDNFLKLSNELTKEEMEWSVLFRNSQRHPTIENGRLAVQKQEHIEKLREEQANAYRVLNLEIVNKDNEPRAVAQQNKAALFCFVDQKRRCTIHYAHESSLAPIQKQHYPRIERFIKEAWKKELKDPKSPIYGVFYVLSDQLKYAHSFAEFCVAGKKLIPKWFRDIYGPWIPRIEPQTTTYLPTKEEQEEDRAALNEVKQYEKILEEEKKRIEEEKEEEGEQKAEEEVTETKEEEVKETKEDGVKVCDHGEDDIF